MNEQIPPKWLAWARRVEAIAEAGLHYSDNEYDLERYRQLRQVAAEIVAEHTTLPQEEVLAHFELTAGYATPKVDVRAAVIEQGKILMVRERIDGGWSLPGGWADVDDMPGNAAERETFEEAGYQVKAERLVGVYDANRLAEFRFHHAFKLVFLCSMNGGQATTSYETSDVGWFAQDEIPQPFSGTRIGQRHIDDCFAAYQDPARPTIFD